MEFISYLVDWLDFRLSIHFVKTFFSKEKARLISHGNSFISDVAFGAGTWISLLFNGENVFIVHAALAILR
jgi:hypothetical protein